MFLIINFNNMFQMRQALSFQHFACCLVQFRGNFGQNLLIIGGLELRGNHQSLTRHFIQYIFQLIAFIGRVQVHQNNAGFKGRKLGNGPFHAVRRPDCKTVTFLKAQFQQTAGKGIHLLLQLPVAQTHILMQADHRILFGVLRASLIKFFTNRCAQ